MEAEWKSPMKMILKRSLVLIPLLVATVFGEAVPLFDGKTLEGWEGDTEKVWRVRDGVIEGGSMEGNPRNEFLVTKKSYRNFILKFDYKLVGTEGFVNGGVQFRSKRLEDPPNEMIGYQADIGGGYSGFLYDESRRKKMLAQCDKKKVEAIEKPGEWNTYKVVAKGPKIELFINGKPTVSYVEKEEGMDDEGMIGLQIHGNCKALISFRNITIEELPDTPVGAK
jgi:hypothetical protein